MENNKDFLGTQPVGKLLFKLAIPTVIAQLINMLYNIVVCFQSYLAFVQCGEDLVAEQVQSFGKFHDTIPLKSSCFQHEPF